MGTKITPCPIFKNPNGGRSKPNKFVVDDLPFPYPRAGYNAKWQKEFRPTLLSWASTFADPYATNTVLDETTMLEMWDIIYPDISLDAAERTDTVMKIKYLVCVVIRYRYETMIQYTFQAGNILNDWRTSIGNGALNVVKNYFLHSGNRFDRDRIAHFVRWALDSRKFNFIYAAPNAEAVCLDLYLKCNTDIKLQNQKQAFRSELIVSMYALHLKKVAGTAAIYGEQIGALALCTTAVSVLPFILLN